MSFYVDTFTSEGLAQHKSWNTNVLITSVASGTLTLTNASETVQLFQGSTSGQILKLPDCTTFAQVGQRYKIINDSTQNLTINDNGGTTLILLGANQRAYLICTSVGTASGSWTYDVIAKSISSIDQFFTTYPGTGLAVNYNGGIFHHDGTTYQVAAGTITLPASTTGGWLYVDIDGVVKATASLPSGALPMYQFTTSGSAVTTLTDMRQDVEDNKVWGVLADIVANTYNSTKSAGTLEKYARADHSHGGSGALIKAGTIASGSFTGTPRTASVTFSTAMPSTSYAITITGVDGRSWVFSNKTTSGFTISSQANQALTGNVDWQAILIGESV